MANVKSNNTWYADSVGNLGSEKSVAVSYIVMTSTAANGTASLRDQQTGDKKLDLGVVASGDTKILDFSRNPIIFPNDIRVDSISNLTLTIVVTRKGA